MESRGSVRSNKGLYTRCIIREKLEACMNNAELLDAVFVYSKSGAVKVLDIEDSKDQHAYLIANGWQH